MSNLKVGDTVRLRGLSHAPEMVILDMVYAQDGFYLCLWFTTAGELRKEVFLPDALEKVARR